MLVEEVERAVFVEVEDATEGRSSLLGKKFLMFLKVQIFLILHVLQL